MQPDVMQMTEMADLSAISHWVWSLIDYLPEEGTQEVPKWPPSGYQVVTNVCQVVTRWSPSVLQVLIKWSLMVPKL